jgi:hypothetical protein
LFAGTILLNPFQKKKLTIWLVVFMICDSTCVFV